MKTLQTYRSASIVTETIDSPPQKFKSALRGLMQRLALAFLAYALAIGGTGSASAGEDREGAVRALGDTLLTLSFKRMPSSGHPYSPKMEPS